MEEKKRDRLTIKTNLLPEDIYNLLSEQADKRNLAHFIIRMIRENQEYQDYKEIINQLKRLEEKIDDLKGESESIPKKIIYDSKFEENSLKEGRLISTEKFSGGMDEEDKKEIDF